MPNKTPSNSIRIFPSSNRSSNSGHYTDNFVTEYNLSSIVNKLLLQGYNKNGTPTSIVYNGVSVPINGFIISDNPTATTIDFNINGYFINVSRSDILNAIGSEKITPSETLYQDFIWFEEINNRVYNKPSSTVTENGKRINYFEFISSLKNEQCNEALSRIIKKINMKKIEIEIEKMPLISDIRREFYKVLLNRRYEIILENSYKKLIKTNKK